MTQATGTRKEAARLRRDLAAAGVALYEDAPDARAPLDGTAYARLLRALLLTGDPRLLVAIPCLLAANDGPAAASAALKVAEGIDAADRARLGLLYRLARALVASRAPDLRRDLGRVPVLEAVPFEPADLPEPASRHGEDLVREAALDSAAGPLAAGAVRAFDTWLGVLVAEGAPRGRS